MPTAPSDDAGDFAHKLSHLFDVVRDTDGSRLTLAAVVARCADAGFPITEGYLSHLRTGRVKTPSFRSVEGLAAAFGVDISYFADHAPPETGALAPTALRDAGVEATAYRLAGLSDDDLQVINDMITVFRSRRS